MTVKKAGGKRNSRNYYFNKKIVIKCNKKIVIECNRIENLLIYYKINYIYNPLVDPNGILDPKSLS